MSADVLTDIFVRSTRLDDSQDPWLDSIIRKELTELASAIPHWSETGCALADIGEFLVRTTTLLSQLANCVVYGEHINTYTERTIQENVIDNDFSELAFLDYMEDKHKCLKSIASKLHRAAEDTDQTWKRSPRPPQSQRYQNQARNRRDLSVPIVSMASGSIYQPEAPAWSRDQDHEELNNPQASSVEAQGGIDDRSPGSNTSAQSYPDERIASLSSRGKGHHMCPRGKDCSKGGVTADGELVVFERNSLFRAHLQKHEKRYKCDIPGCTNKTGFARKDQLRRHKESVAHR